MKTGLARLPGPMLLITDRKQARKPLVEIIEAAMLGGCRWVSLREKDVPFENRLALLNDIVPIVRRFGGTIMVHADMNAAMRVDGVHLPGGTDAREARRRLGENARIGLSCHTLEDVQNAGEVDYVTLGPFAPTKSKPDYWPTFGPDILHEITSDVPVLALGGVDEKNLAELKRSGAAGFAVMGNVMRSDDPQKVVEDLLALWNDES